MSTLTLYGVSITSALVGTMVIPPAELIRCATPDIDSLTASGIFDVGILSLFRRAAVRVSEHQGVCSLCNISYRACQRNRNSQIQARDVLSQCKRRHPIDCSILAAQHHYTAVGTHSPSQACNEVANIALHSPLAHFPTAFR